MLAVVFPAVSRLSKRKMLWLSILLVTSMWPLQADKKKKKKRGDLHYFHMCQLYL